MATSPFLLFLLSHVLVAQAGGVAGWGLVKLELAVASKCPDASRCENTFLPQLLASVGDLVDDVSLTFIAESNASEASGFTCMHGADECMGNMVQLCAQRYWPVNVGSDGVDAPALNRRHVWTRLLHTFLDTVE